MDNRAVGIFDSGVGGLTVLNALQNALPRESFIYVADTAHAPYGGKTVEQLLQRGRHIIDFLLAQNVKAIVMACGTSSSNTYTQLQAEYPQIPIIDTMRPAANATAKLAATGSSVAFLATQATVASGCFQSLMAAASPRVTIHAVACPLFAPMAEMGHNNTPLSRVAAHTYLAHLHGKVSLAVLGCTHYPLLAAPIRHALGDIHLLDPAAAVADVLYEAIHHTAATTGNVKYFTNGCENSFEKLAKIIRNEQIHVNSYT
jgi:glutamate racemase